MWTGDELVYLAPESFAAQKFDQKADMYSLAMLLTHLLTGMKWIRKDIV